MTAFRIPQPLSAERLARYRSTRQRYRSSQRHRDTRRAWEARRRGLPPPTEPAPPRVPPPLPALLGPTLGGLLAAIGGVRRPKAGGPRLTLSWGSDQQGVAAALRLRLAALLPGVAPGLAPTDRRRPAGGSTLWLNHREGLRALLTAALPFCPAATLPPSLAALPTLPPLAPLPKAADGGAAPCCHWALAVALSRGHLVGVAPEAGGGFSPRLELTTLQQREAAAESALLATFAAATGGRREWRSTAGVSGARRATVGAQWVVLEGPPLAALGAVLEGFPLGPAAALGGRWPLLPEALALATADGGDPAVVAAREALRSRWRALPSGRTLGGQRKTPSLGGPWAAGLHPPNLARGILPPPPPTAKAPIAGRWGAERWGVSSAPPGTGPPSSAALGGGRRPFLRQV